MSLNAMIDEAMATAARLNAVLERIEKTLGEPKKSVRYFGYGDGGPIWRENADGSFSVNHGGGWIKSSFHNFGDLAVGNTGLIEVPAPEGES